ncbi:hypothetical protein BV898_00073 [Hypsibius exemplaris]|uniref:Chitin-binding type-2 domain-containing protein n=1 Tax=Hypsibius exemplaris TaxID=2072580 RepID=A0A1W0XF01_HYPEX|nr:hypothetical protein BV898_00073 [Hypsibius exemplaris]
MHNSTGLVLLFCIIIALVEARVVVERASSRDQLQTPKVWDALNLLRGKDQLTAEQIQELYQSAVSGTDFPLLSVIPDESEIDCATFKQPGFYADVDVGRCQVFHRCDINGKITSYLCPNMTMFNQITLICDWFYNVDCNKARQFYDYSNSRLYKEGIALLNNQDDVPLSTGAVAQSASKASGSKSKPKAARKTKRSKISFPQFFEI